MSIEIKKGLLQLKFALRFTLGLLHHLFSTLDLSILALLAFEFGSSEIMEACSGGRRVWV